ncbi:MAG TPA: asparagine synthase (glutamine-hydrolyzing) [Gemmatimonadales bacterium]|nr:asparagine synthase (glutamine-hydrolyzing) [Gemmatimonadales bacterium]
MCGLCGVAYADPGMPADAGTIRRMTGMLSHRGPDGQGYFLEDGIGLGFRRLSIIDLEGGDQPMSNEDGSITVVCNGEIYNYRELRRSLESAGHRFRSRSDVEVIVHLYEDHGVGCLDRLRGMFAFALWDSRRRRLMLARDRFGIKPLSYAVTADALYFGSEYKAILAADSVERRVDGRAIRELFETGFLLAPHTLLTSVRRLLPAHYLLYEAGRITTRRYWDLSFPPQGEEDLRQSPEDWASALRGKLGEAVTLHLRSDVPLGSYLSSGIDSSAMASLMSRQLPDPVHTFSVRFEDPAYDEVGQQRILADYAGYDLSSHVTTCTTAAFDLLPKLIWHQEDPNLSAGGIPHLQLAHSAARHVKTVLTGEGSDEVFGGYHWHRIEKMLGPFLGLPLGLRRFVAGMPLLRRKWPGHCRAFSAPSAMTQERYMRIIDNASRKPVAGIFGERCGAESGPDQQAVEPLRVPDGFHHWHRLAQTQYWEINTRMTDYVIRTLDAGTMAYGLEARVPFLDHEFVEFCGRIPARLKIRWLDEKHILRRALEKDLPAEILKRKKRGLAAPHWPWKQRLPEFASQALSEPSLRDKGYFKPKAIRSMLECHNSGEARFGKELLGVVSIQLWDDLFVRGVATSMR